MKEHIQIRNLNLCKLCMPTYTSFERAQLSADEQKHIIHEDCSCRVCLIIKDKLLDFQALQALQETNYN